METKQTAVEWLEDKINNYDFNQGMAQMRKYILQAKEMEKEQHDLTFARGSMTGYANANGYEGVDFKQFYNKTYGKENSN
jgi:hypothetical protein